MAPTPDKDAALGAATRKLLLRQASDLSAAINEALRAGVVIRVDYAQAQLAKVRARLADTDLALAANAGFYGENGWAAAISDTIRTLRFHTGKAIEARAVTYQDAAGAKRLAAEQIERIAA